MSRGTLVGAALLLAAVVILLLSPSVSPASVSAQPQAAPLPQGIQTLPSITPEWQGAGACAAPGAENALAYYWHIWETTNIRNQLFIVSDATIAARPCTCNWA